MKKKALSLLLALALCLGLMPTAFAAPSQPVSSNNKNKQDYTTWATTAAPSNPTTPAMPTTPITPTYPVSGFNDVPSTHWAYQYIMACAEKGTVEGKGGGRFDPNGAVTYAQFAKMLTVTFFPKVVARLEAEPRAAGKPWYWVYMNAAYNDSLFANTQVKSTGGSNVSSDGASLIFLPDGDINTWANVPMTRYDMAEMAYNTLRRWTEGYYDPVKDVSYLGIDFSTDTPTYMEKLTDGRAIPSDHQTAIAACMHMGIINGMNDSSFSGSGTMTRAQACKVMVTLVDAIEHVNLKMVDGPYQT